MENAGAPAATKEALSLPPRDGLPGNRKLICRVTSLGTRASHLAKNIPASIKP